MAKKLSITSIIKGAKAARKTVSLGENVLYFKKIPAYKVQELFADIQEKTKATAEEKLLPEKKKLEVLPIDSSRFNALAKAIEEGGAEAPQRPKNRYEQKLNEYIELLTISEVALFILETEEGESLQELLNDDLKEKQILIDVIQSEYELLVKLKDYIFNDILGSMGSAQAKKKK